MAIQESKGKVISLSVVLPTFATSMVLLRVRARRSRAHPFKIDDYFILFALVKCFSRMRFPRLNLSDLSMG